MFIRIVGLLVALWGMWTCGMISAHLSDQEFEEVNRALPPERQFKWFKWKLYKWLSVSRESRRLGIRPRYRWRQVRLGILTFAFAGVFAWLLSSLR